MDTGDSLCGINTAARSIHKMYNNNIIMIIIIVIYIYIQITGFVVSQMIKP